MYKKKVTFFEQFFFFAHDLNTYLLIINIMYTNYNYIDDCLGFF